MIANRSGQCFAFLGLPMLMLWCSEDDEDTEPVLIINPHYAHYTAAMIRKEAERNG